MGTILFFRIACEVSTVGGGWYGEAFSADMAFVE
jgi:hypothetical protein